MTGEITQGQPPVPEEPAPEEPVRYEQRGAVALVTLNRPRYRNAQNSAMTYALDAAAARAVNAEDVAVIVLAGAGDHFCAGHDIGTAGRGARFTACRWRRASPGWSWIACSVTWPK